MITAYLVAWNSDRTGDRYFHVTAPLYIAMIAFILAASTTAIVPRYTSMMLMIPGFYSSWSIVFAWTSSAIPRPASKRAAALALVNATANCANIFGSYMYQKDQSPRYGESLRLFGRYLDRMMLKQRSSSCHVGKYRDCFHLHRGRYSVTLYLDEREQDQNRR
ncbi:Major facilitator superfamily domain general substrate transporter [Macrophomina phaseolina MS6]|uniref:Major facilitator superfamily domain general substrate transporter n=1 Tax=Macrophomina phaseolina (strain MS6) TaxID=1126212 RepID=K2S1K2_MACPH|nr:Major facilitator superfamily domain general substrate transporter [Macrophomina phaseolina MS6]